MFDAITVLKRTFTVRLRPAGGAGERSGDSGTQRGCTVGCGGGSFAARQIAQPRYAVQLCFRSCGRVCSTDCSIANPDSRPGPPCR